MSTSRTETYNFRNIPVRVTGNSIVARISGEVEWTLLEMHFKHIAHLWLTAEDDALVEILPDEDMWSVAQEAVTEDALKRTPRRVPKSDEPYNHKTDLDNAVVEGAKQTSG